MQAAGVELPDRLGPLELASSGVRRTFWIEHYVAALYAPPERSPVSAMADAGVAKAIVVVIADDR